MARAATKKTEPAAPEPKFSVSHCNFTNARTPMTEGEVEALKAVAQAIQANADALTAAMSAFTGPDMRAPFLNIN